MREGEGARGGIPLLAIDYAKSVEENFAIIIIISSV